MGAAKLFVLLVVAVCVHAAVLWEDQNEKEISIQEIRPAPVGNVGVNNKNSLRAKPQAVKKSKKQAPKLPSKKQAPKLPSKKLTKNKPKNNNGQKKGAKTTTTKLVKSTKRPAQDLTVRTGKTKPVTVTAALVTITPITQEPLPTLDPVVMQVQEDNLGQSGVQGFNVIPGDLLFGPS
ncbi:Hypothetical predicted protein [Cloeon dipterum]|uniref:Uncharacterized protein n=1 Tax=Cloeon dipterum TaxID=197152 RepID=A0A8S1DXP4_9INSE|nr:Hypothetical predicted protein [Cloeon dipterum]